MLKWILAIGIGLRVVLWCFQVSPAGDDGGRYMRESMNLAGHGVFSSQEGVDGAAPAPDAHDMPLWPSIMAVAYRATGSVKAAERIAGALNIGFALGSALLLASMLRRRPFAMDERQIAVAVGLMLFVPDGVIYSLFHMPDQLAVFAFVTGLWFALRRETASLTTAAAAGAAFLVSIYAKPICLPLTVALAAAIPFALGGTFRRKAGAAVLGIAIILAGLCPWVARNKAVFGTAGLASISGTNLYGCNWGWMVGQLPQPERDAACADMARFEASIADFDLMKRSQLQGAYARRQILSHLPEYCAFTARQHPKLYAGTGTIALLRYLGFERASDSLEEFFKGAPPNRGFGTPSPAEKTCAVILQFASWAILLACYALAAVGAFRGLGATRRSGFQPLSRVAVLLPLLSILLLAAVIGPVTATRYRFVMIPFFAMLAGSALRPHQCCCKCAENVVEWGRLTRSGNEVRDMPCQRG